MVLGPAEARVHLERRREFVAGIDGQLRKARILLAARPFGRQPDIGGRRDIGEIVALLVDGVIRI